MTHPSEGSEEPGTGRLGVNLFWFFSLSVVIISCAFFALSIGKPYMGIKLSLDDGHWAVEFVERNGLANHAGIKSGDRPSQINDKPAEIFLDKYTTSALVIGRGIVNLTVIDAQGGLKSVSLNDTPPTLSMLMEGTAWFLVCLVFWATGLYVLFKKPRNVAALLLYLCGLALGLALTGNMAGERAIPAATWFEVAGTVMFPWLLLHFFLVLPEERAWLRARPAVLLLYLPAVVTLALFPVFGYFDGQPVQWFRTVRLIGYGAGFLAAVGMAFFNYFHSASFRTHQQMKIVLFSTLVALVPFAFLNIVPEVIWRQTILPTEISLVLFASIPVGMGYAVVNKKLMDIDVVIRRTVIYGCITLAMAIILSAAIIPLMTIREIGLRGEIAAALVIGAAATFLFGPIQSSVEKLVDRLFYKDRYDYRQIIQSLSVSLNAVKGFTEVSRLVVGTTVHALNLAGGCLFVKAHSGDFRVGAAEGAFADRNLQNDLAKLISCQTPDVEFPNSASTACPGLSFLVPLVAGEREVGVLYLSPKASRQSFSPDDIYLIQGIASVAAVALHSAMLINDVSLRDTFVSVASHELRTPLTSIVGYADLLLRRDPPPETRKRWLDNILNSAQRVGSIVDDLLNVTRIQSGKANIKLEPVNLPDILEELVAAARESSTQHDFEIAVESGLPEALVDSNKFAQILSNILNNAIKYSPQGRRIKISAHSKEPNRILVAVADEGIGISPEDADQLFTPFHRIKRPETEAVRGSGLGLYIAKEWTEAMGGKIWVESEVNKGSTFFISIQVKTDRQADSTNETG